MVAPYADQISERIKLDALGSAVSSNFRSGVWVKDTLELEKQETLSAPTQKPSMPRSPSTAKPTSQSIMRF
ncbi:hypothetical protein BGZ92_004446, partial [Podila epicladia]